jgi:hypothetical protein
LVNKSETHLELEVDPLDKAKSIVTFPNSRGKSPEPFAFEIMDTDEGFAVPLIAEGYTIGGEERDVATIMAGLFDKHGPLSAGALTEAIVRQERVSERKAERLKTQAKRERIITSKREGKQVFYSLFYAEKDEDLPF